eukprot:COSAG02_NODE_49305_length_327_cov_1.368421_1_plen_65_part_10
MRFAVQLAMSSETFKWAKLRVQRYGRGLTASATGSPSDILKNGQYGNPSLPHMLPGGPDCENHIC